MERLPKDEKINETELEVSNLEQKYLNEEGEPGIEGEIKPLVVSLRMLRFNTTGSCGGHEKKSGKDEYPYVIICANWYDSSEDPEDWDMAINDWEAEVSRLQKFIDDYSLNRDINKDEELIKIKKESKGWMAIEFNKGSVKESQDLVLDFAEYLREQA